MASTAILALVLCGHGAAETAAEAVPADEWPVYRGTRALIGRSAATLPASLDKAWEFTLDGGLAGPAVVRDDTVYLTARGGLYLVGLADGVERKHIELAAGANSAVDIHDGTAVVALQNYAVQAIDLASGESRWQAEADDSVQGTPAIHIDEDGRAVVVFCSDDFNAYCHDLGTGERLWAFSTDNYIYGGAAIAQGKAVFGGCDQVLYAVDIASGTSAKEALTPSYMQASPAVAWPLAFTGTGDKETGVFVCVDLEQEVEVWAYDAGEGPYVGIPAVGAEEVVFGGQDMVLYCLERKTGSERWTFIADDSIAAAPTIVGDKVICSVADGRIHLLDLATGRKLWSYDCGGGLFHGAAVAGGHVIVGTSRGRVLAFTGKATAD
ncbi:MAG: PQQ-binding-like beta-propeller repeat protein [Planctomycetota bacterium]